MSVLAYEQCINCPLSLMCASDGGACLEGIASSCAVHEVVYLWAAPERFNSVHRTQWCPPNYFARLFGVACNCEAAALCPNLAEFGHKAKELVEATKYTTSSLGCEIEEPT